MNCNQESLFRSVKEIEKKLDVVLQAINGENISSDRLISVKEASKILNRSEYCLRLDINNGRIPAKKVGRGYLLSYNHVQQMVNDPEGF